MSNSLPLGKSVNYPEHYDPDILFKIERKTSEHSLNGYDRWFCYELSFLLQNGYPVCIGLEIIIPAQSNFIVESKSLKLYLGSLASEKFDDISSCLNQIKSDLQKLLESKEISLSAFDLKNTDSWAVSALPGICIDKQEIDCFQFEQASNELIQIIPNEVNETLNSNVFRSLCPVTQQPDFASLVVQYQGLKIVPESLVRYLASYRKHSGFHESCCEQIFEDLLLLTKPKLLTVACYFTRRGGIEINPIRSTEKINLQDWQIRAVRQ